MDWHAVVGIIAGIIQIASVFPYVRSMIKGTTRPNIISFVLWTTLQIIAIAAQFSAGASWSIIILITTTFNTALILVVALSGYGYRKYGALDYTCFALAIIAIGLWQITKQPLVALILAVLADLISTIPTIAKTYREPYSENVLGWAMIAVAAILAAVSTTKFDIANLIYPIYLIFANTTITALAFFGQHLNKKPPQSGAI